MILQTSRLLEEAVLRFFCHLDGYLLIGLVYISKTLAYFYVQLGRDSVVVGCNNNWPNSTLCR